MALLGGLLLGVLGILGSWFLATELSLGPAMRQVCADYTEKILFLKHN